jgi:hypothetical protein
MAPDTPSARARLDEVEAGLDAIEDALRRLDAGDLDGDATDPVAHDVPDAPAQPDDAW